MIHSTSKTFVRSQKHEFSSNASQGNGHNRHQQKEESRVFETTLHNGNDQKRNLQEQKVFEMPSPSGNKQQGLAFEMQSQQGIDQQNGQHRLDGWLQLPRNGHEQHQQRYEAFKQHARSGSRQQELAFDRQSHQENDYQKHQQQVVNEGLQEQVRSGNVQQRNQPREVHQALHTQARNDNQQQLQQPNNGLPLQTQTHHGNQQQRHQHKEGHKHYHRHRTHHAHHSSHAYGSHNATSRQGYSQERMVNGKKSFDASKSRADLLDPGKSNMGSTAQTSKPEKEQSGSKKASLTSAIASLNVSLLAPANPNAASVSPKLTPKTERKKGYGAGDPLYGYFSSVAGADQQIEAVELQRCLTQSGIAGNYQMFSLETCRIMISMLDRDYSGKMGFNEFKELWNCLNQWRGTFYQYDADRSGTVEPHELHNAIRSWGYNLTPQALNIIVKRYSTDGRISFDNFIGIAVRLRLLTDSFRRRDATQTGFAQFGYDDFIQMTMYC